MEVLWVLPVAVLLVGLYVLFRAFVRLQAAMQEVRGNLAELAEIAPRLQGLAQDVAQLSESIEEKRQQ